MTAQQHRLGPEEYPFDAEVVVVGGGLAGLTAAALAARAGRRTILLERSSRLGGRAATTEQAGVQFNLGPHALYCHGRAFGLLRELGVEFVGNFPAGVGRYFRLAGRLYAVPTGFWPLVTSRLLSWNEKFQLMKFLRELPTLDARALDDVSLELWLTQKFGRGTLTAVLRTLIRVATYADDWRRLSAGAAIDQFRIGLLGNVWYLDHGWETLIDGLRTQAERYGAIIRASAPVRHVASVDRHVVVELGDGRNLRAGTAIIAADPETAVRLLDLPAEAPLGQFAERRIPIRAACLDVALKPMPRPDRNVTFDLDRSLYYSVHSYAAQLGPEGTAVMHVAKYLPTDDALPAKVTEAELEASLDHLQPGWRTHVVARRYLPSMTVAHGLPTADEGGLAGRPKVAVAQRPGIFLAGDWVGARGMLADASAASAQESAEHAELYLRSGPLPTATARGDNRTQPTVVSR